MTARAPSADRLRLFLTRSRPYLRARDRILRAGRRTYWVVREDLARRYLSGQGIEIGAMTQPLRVPPGVSVRYVDRMTREELIRTEGPQLAEAGIDPADLAPVDVVAGAPELEPFADGSLDFVIANHVLEHLEDPIDGLTGLIRVIRPGGVLFLVLPDPRHTFDRRRARTTVEHVVRDHEGGPESSRREHYLEWARDIEDVPPDRVQARVEEFAAQDARHHFHVWELRDFLALLLAVPLPAEIIHAQAYLNEYAVILRRTGPA